MKFNKFLKITFFTLIILMLFQNSRITARTCTINIDYIGYCDLDNDGKNDDVYAEVFITMWEGTNFLTLEASLKFHGQLIYSIYRDNHVRTESEITYRFYFYNATYEAGWYVFSVWFQITNGENSAYLHRVKAFDPPEGDPDYPPGGGLDPGP